MSVAEQSIFGPIVTGGDVEGWLLALLQKWFSTYLSELERNHGLAACTLPRPLSYELGPSFDKWPEDQVPAVLVSSRGTLDQPRRYGDGSYRARWALEPGVVCSARTQAEAHNLATLYGAAIRALLKQKPSLEGHANGVVWLGESYDDLGYDDSRSLYTVKELFAVEVEEVSYDGAGPTAPDPGDPCADWPPWPEVQTVEIDVDNVTVDQPLPEEEP